MGETRMKFEVAGPFVLTRHTGKNLITKKSKADLKEVLKLWDSELDEACGCYVFAIKAAKGWRPYYAGQALRRSILDESMNSSNMAKYNEAMGDRKAGTPVMFLLPWLTNSATRYRKKTKKNAPGSRTLDFLENWLISVAYEKNRELINIKKTKHLRDLHVVGVFNGKRGEGTADSKQFNLMTR
jgi:hypothetical protein